MKRYTFQINGVTKFKNVSPENEQKFFDKYGEYNPTLVPEEPGKSQGTSQSQSNQQQANTESNLVDGSSEPQKLEGTWHSRLYDNVTGTIGSLKDPEERKKAAELAYTGFVENAPESLTRLLLDVDSSLNQIRLKSGILSEEAKEEVENSLIENDKALKALRLTGGGLELKDLPETYFTPSGEWLNKYIPGAGDIKLQQKDTGAGFVKGFKNQSAADVIGASSTFILGAAETIVPAMITRGRSLFPQVTAPMISAYNEEKAKSIYGEGSDAMEKLVKSGDTELTVPVALGYAAYQLEKIGFKGINSYILGKPAANKIAGTLMATSLKEGVTEYFQGGITKINESLGGGKSVEEASIDAWEHMLSDDGLEDFFSGVVGGGAMSGGGKLVNRGLRNNDESLGKINTQIDKIVDLNIKKNKSLDKDVRNSIDINIKTETNTLKNIINNNRKLSEFLSEEQRSSLIDIIQTKDLAAKTKKSLDSKIDSESITQQEYDNAIESLNNEDAKLNDQLVDIKTKAVELAAETQFKTVKDQIKKFGLQGEAKQMTTEEIANMDLGEADAKKASGEFGFIRQFADGSFEIIINKDKPTVGTAAHEFLHAVLAKTLSGNEQIQNELSQALKQYVSTLKGTGFEALNNRLESYKNDTALGEEVIVVMSESILDGSLKFNEGFFSGIGDTIRRFLQSVGLKDIEFNTGKDVYNFIKDYNNSIKTGNFNKAIINVVKKGAKGKLVSNTLTTSKKEEVGTKFSKDAKPAVDDLAVDPNTGENYIQEEWDRVGAKRAIEQFKIKRKEFENQGYLDGLIASKYKVKLAYNELQSFVADVLGSREFINMINRFNRGKRNTLDENDSLFGYIQGQLRFRADDVFKEAERGRLPKDVKSTDINERTSDGQLKVQVGDTDTQTTKFEEQEIKLNDKEVQEANPEARERKSTFRKEVGIKGIGKSIIFKAVKTAIITADAITNPKKFLNSYEKTLANSLFDYMKKVFPDTNSMVKYRIAILESIPIPTLIQMQKQLTEKIFVKSYGRLTNKTQISDFVYGRNESGKNPGNKKLLTDDILNDTEVSKRKRAAGVVVYERLQPSSTQWNNYLEAAQKGKRQTSKRSGTKGNNRIKVLEESAKALGKDATPENLTPSFIQEYIDKKGLESEMSVQEVTNTINKAIGRPPDLKFSKSPKFANTPINKTAAQVLSQEKIQEGSRFYKNGILTVNVLRDYSIDDVVNLDTMTGKKGTLLENVPQDVIEYVVKELYITGKIDYVDGIVLDKLSKAVPKGDPRTKGFEQYIMNQFAKIPGVEAVFEYQSEEGIDIPDFYGTMLIEGKKVPFNVEIKMFDAQISSLTINSINIATGKVVIDKINNLSDKNKNKVNKQTKKLIKVFRTITSRMRELSDMTNEELTLLATELNNNISKKENKIKVPIKITEKDKKYLNEYNSPNDLMPNYAHQILKAEKYWNRLTQIEMFDQSLIEDLYLNKAIPTNYIYMLGKGFFHLGTDVLNLGSTKLEAKFAGSIRQVKASQYKSENKVRTKTGYVTINMRLLPTLQKDSLKNKSSMDIISKENIDNFLSKEIKEKMKLSRSIKVSKAHDTIIKYSKTGKTRGMSTFDFDETVGISENFIIAKKDGKTEKISSDRWPFVGDQMIEDGWVMDFSDFDKVTKGKPGPLFVKMENQIAKYGPENVFILTARGPGSQIAIHEWLKQNGINIPLKNVTGLGQSSGDAKAQWMLDKFAEGYNDMYFVDDALPNVEAVKEVLDQLDIKSKVVQAKIKYSKSLNTDFNDMLERSKGVDSNRRFSAAEARVRGAQGKWTFFVPPSAEDFKGLMRNIVGKGKQGNADLAWFKKALFDPWAKAYIEFNNYKQRMTDEYTDLKKRFPTTVKSLKEKVPGMPYTNDTAVRVYLWSKAGFSIPGLSTQEQYKLIEHVEGNRNLRSFANHLSTVTRIKEGYLKPNEFWTTETIATDLANAVNKVGRTEFLQEWIANKNIIFSQENLNKLEAIYGTDYVDALQDMLHRMETGTNRVTGKNKMVNGFMDWINGSVGAVMFFNMRSAVLQTISMVNFLNFENNNIFAASKAFANQPQFWADFIFLMNSPMLKQRRAGLQIDVSASELTKAYAEGGNKAQAIIAYLLEKGFTPTKIADSFAIAMGGSAYYRNQVNFYLKQGMTKAKAESQAFLDFQEIAEETQQSSRPDMISQQQAGPLGRLILAWQNTPMQMTRLTKKALQDLVNGRGDAKANVSRILYYGLVQNLIFGALQTALFAVMFGDDEEEIEKREIRIANGALDTLLRGSGIYGSVIATIKNTYMQWRVQRKKSFGKRQDYRIMQELIGLSPPLGTKFRKIMSAIKTEQYNKGVGRKLGFRIENPNFHIVANLIEAGTNAPVARLLHKANNLEEAITGNHTLMQRLFVGMGWSMWSMGIKDEELEAAKDAARKDRKNNKTNNKDSKTNKKGKKVQCSAIKSNGKRCGVTGYSETKGWKCMHHAAFTDGMDRDGDGKKEYRCIGTKKDGNRCKNKTENKNKKCYAHQ